MRDSFQIMGLMWETCMKEREDSIQITMEFNDQLGDPKPNTMQTLTCPNQMKKFFLAQYT